MFVGVADYFNFLGFFVICMQYPELSLGFIEISRLIFFNDLHLMLIYCSLGSMRVLRVQGKAKQQQQQQNKRTRLSKKKPMQAVFNY